MYASVVFVDGLFSCAFVRHYHHKPLQTCSSETHKINSPEFLKSEIGVIDKIRILLTSRVSSVPQILSFRVWGDDKIPWCLGVPVIT